MTRKCNYRLCLQISFVVLAISLLAYREENSVCVTKDTVF